MTTYKMMKTKKTPVEVEVELPFYYSQHFDSGDWLTGRVGPEETVVVHVNNDGYEVEVRKTDLDRSACYHCTGYLDEGATFNQALSDAKTFLAGIIYE